MVWPAVIAAGAGLLGGKLGNQASAKQARKNRDFQERMSSTAHQRQVADLRAAGLNPILSASSGASTPGGAQAQQHDIITPAVNTALSAKRTNAEVKNLAEQNKLLMDQQAATRAGTTNTEANTRVAEATEHNARLNADLISNQTLAASALAAKTAHEATLTSLAIPRAQLDNLIYSGPDGRNIRIAEMSPAAALVAMGSDAARQYPNAAKVAWNLWNTKPAAPSTRRSPNRAQQLWRLWTSTPARPQRN